MQTYKRAFTSSLGKKFVMALTGLGLGGFVISHLLGNILLYSPNGAYFNKYAKGLADFGPLLYVAEIGLLALFILHVITAYGLKFLQKKARPINYASVKSKGGPSKSNLGSRNMWVTGTFLLLFLIWHILHFKFGPGMNQGYTAEVQGVVTRDLYRLVIEEFHKPAMVALYVFSMLLLGFHLRHGYWSMFQSLGLMNPRFSKPIHTGALLLAWTLALGFLFIPIWIYFDLGRLL